MLIPMASDAEKKIVLLMVCAKQVHSVQSYFRYQYWPAKDLYWLNMNTPSRLDLKTTRFL